MLDILANLEYTDVFKVETAPWWTCTLKGVNRDRYRKGRSAHRLSQLLREVRGGCTGPAQSRTLLQGWWRRVQDGLAGLVPLLLVGTSRVSEKVYAYQWLHALVQRLALLGRQVLPQLRQGRGRSGHERSAFTPARENHHAQAQLLLPSLPSLTCRGVAQSGSALHSPSVERSLVQIQPLRPIKTFQIFRGKSLLTRPAFGGSRFAKSPVFWN